MTRTGDVDALVVGAGVGGIYATYLLSRMGLDVVCIDVAGDVGGTWYWNRYPGAMSDTESYLYRYSWDKDDLQTYPWDKHYVYQPEILTYLRHVTDKHDLRKYMQFGIEMTSAHWDDQSQRWKVTFTNGQRISTRYLVNSIGLLSKPNYPNIPGINDFRGEKIHTAKWNHDVPLEGKRVGIIGNGSTGVQVMTAIAPKVGQLISFQRHPQYSVPTGQAVVPPGYRKDINARYDEIWQGVWNSAVGFGIPEVTAKTMDATPEERQQAFQRVWDQGNGFRFMFSAFGDLTTDRKANEEACKFIRGKIDEIVKDPRKAHILKPRDLYARRPLCDSGYYQIFNRENVDLVDLRETPIESIVADGIKTVDGTLHKLDTLVFATGFDSIEGNYLRISITGRDGKTIKEHWKNGPTSYGAICCAGFPNMFMISGPQSPFANFPPVIESEIEFIMAAIARAEENIRTVRDAAEDIANVKSSGPLNGFANHSVNGSANRQIVLEATEEAERMWMTLCERLVENSLFKDTASWIFGANIDGRPPTTRFYFGGLKSYREWTSQVVADGFPGFKKFSK